MAQDHQPERESGIRNHELGGKTAEEKPDFEVREQGTENREQRAEEKPTIPDIQKPELPQEKSIPTGGPGDQGQTQQTTQPQTQEKKTKKIKEELGKLIHINTPQERRDASEREDEHNRDVLSQE